MRTLLPTGSGMGGRSSWVSRELQRQGKSSWSRAEARRAQSLVASTSAFALGYRHWEKRFSQRSRRAAENAEGSGGGPVGGGVPGGTPLGGVRFLARAIPRSRRVPEASRGTSDHTTTRLPRALGVPFEPGRSRVPSRARELCARGSSSERRHPSPEVEATRQRLPGNSAPPCLRARQGFSRR